MRQILPRPAPFLALAFAALLSLPAQAADPTFTVSGIHVDASAASAAAAQAIAIDQGRPKAWDILYKRVARQTDFTKEPKLDAIALRGLARGYTVANERRSTTRYVAGLCGHAGAAHSANPDGAHLQPRFAVEQRLRQSALWRQSGAVHRSLGRLGRRQRTQPAAIRLDELGGRRACRRAHSCDRGGDRACGSDSGKDPDLAETHRHRGDADESLLRRSFGPEQRGVDVCRRGGSGRAWH